MRLKSRFLKIANMPGAAAAEVIRGSLAAGGALPRQELAFQSEPELATAPPAAAIAAERAVPGDHPVAGDRQRDRVPTDRPADGPSRAATPDRRRDRAVARGRAPGDLADRAQDEPIPGRPVGEVEWQLVERVGTAVEERAQGRHASIEMRLRVAAVAAGSWLRPPEPSLQLSTELIRRREDVDGDDPARRPGHVDRAAGPRHGRDSNHGRRHGVEDSRATGPGRGSPMLYSPGV